MPLKRDRRGRTHTVLGAATLALVVGLADRATAAAIVECADARGVPVLTSASDGANACVGAPRAPHARRDGAVATAAVATFPRVDAATQQRRDDDRVRILTDELGDERGRLAALEARERATTAGAGGDAATRRDVDERLARMRENVQALQRELAGVPSR